jgi:hypothetical protein
MRLAIATAFALIALPATALSQGVRIDPLSLQSGARARILAPTAGSKYELITVGSASPDSLRYNLYPSLATRSLAWQQISKMDASMGRHTNGARGAGIGFLVGAIGGAILGGRSRAVFGGIAGGTLGGLVGAVVGFGQQTENWIPVALPRTAATPNRRSINESRP